MKRYLAAAAAVVTLLGLTLPPLRSGADVPADPVPVSPPVTASAGDDSPEAKPAEPPLVDVRGTAGFWRIAQDSEGVWWFLSPDDRREFLNTVTTVQPYQLGRRPLGPHYVSRDWATLTGGDVRGSRSAGETTQPVLRTRLSPGDDRVRRWADVTLERVRAAGFKGLGAWCHPVFHDLDVPATRDLNVWTWTSGDARRLYHPQWAEIVEAAIARQVTPLRDNPRLVGYFTDNEIDWGDAFAGPGVYFNGLATNDPNRREVLKVIRTLWPTVEAFDADWGTTLARTPGAYDTLDSLLVLPTSRPEIYQRLASAWLEHLARDYFRITTELVRKYDPNHLILGVRFKGHAPPEVVRASKGYTDAVSLNYYVPDAKLDRPMFEMMHRESGGQPVMITEYSFHALDGRSGNRNTFGFAAQVYDQQARADAYRLKTTRLARVPWVIGADWFQWSDEPPSGRTMDGEDVNFGVVDVDDREYDKLTTAVRETTPLLNSLHAASVRDVADPETDVWRRSFSRRPTMHVPYLANPPRIDGNLADWPAENKLYGMRPGETVGLDRHKLPLPDVRIGWRDEGLYVAAIVYDDDIHGAPADGGWWTRDCLEFWVATKPVPDEQTYFTPECHQFFFVPKEFPGPDGAAGVTGRWHRKGDGLSAPLIPHPQVVDAARVLPDRYVVEMFIPAGALYGFDPSQEPNLAFNLHVSNFQQAATYFWSAPKELMTQSRPNTWGRLVLLPPTTPSEADTPRTTLAGTSDAPAVAE